MLDFTTGGPCQRPTSRTPTTGSRELLGHGAVLDKGKPVASLPWHSTKVIVDLTPENFLWEHDCTLTYAG